MVIIPSFDFELKIGEDKIVAGVDEVGRGALAGPIVAAAVVFENYKQIKPILASVIDSKKLSASKRIKIDELIRRTAADLSIGKVEADEIDRIGIGAANILAFKKALDGLKKCDFALIDGRKFRGFEYKYRCIEKGESHSISIAAASIIAKVYRDNLMKKASTVFPDYGFESNMGYGGKSHYEVLIKNGPSTFHRKSFLEKLKLDQGHLF